MQGRIFLVVLAMAVLVAGCGGASANLGSDDVALVGSTHISRSAFDTLLSLAKVSYKSQGQTFPKPGSPGYSAIKSQAVALLVQRAEQELEGQKLDVKVSDRDVETRLKEIKKQDFGGSEKTYQKELKSLGITDQEVREQIVKPQLVNEKIATAVTKDVAVNPAAVHAYYVAHKKDYESRQVRHILVKDKVLVDRLYQQIKGGADFATLAKKYSQDPGSASQGGKFTAHNGQEVAAFDKVAFSIGNDELAPPVRSPEYGWFIIQAQGPVKTSPEPQVTGTIQSQLLQQKKSAALTSWANKVAKSYCKGGEIDYQAGYQPVPDPCAQFTGTTTTTTP